MTRFQASVIALAVACGAVSARGEDPKPGRRREVLEVHDPAAPPIPARLVVRELVNEADGVALASSWLPSSGRAPIARAIADLFRDKQGRHVTSSTVNDKDPWIVLLRVEESGRRTLAAIGRSRAGYPILPRSALEGTIIAKGLSPAENTAFLEAVARAIARRGSCRALLVLPNGNAADIHFEVDASDPVAVSYKDTLVGSYSVVDFDVIVKGADTWSATTYDEANARSVFRGAEVRAVR